MNLSENNVHLFFQLYLRIKNDIMLGELPRGEKLPNIEILHQMYGVSHGTVRRALELLGKEGLISKKRGAGTFINHDIDLTAVFSGADVEDVQSILEASRYTTLSKSWVLPPRRVVKLFADQEGVYKKGRILKLKKFVKGIDDQRRLTIADIYLPACVAEKLDERVLRSRSIYAAIIRDPEFKADKLKQIIHPWVCDTEAGNYLNLLPGTPVFHRAWLMISKDNEALVYSESLITARSLEREIDL